jgi:cytochrome c-type biogenesis protein
VEQLFSSLSHALEGSAAAALLAAFVWGVLSVVLSPCHLASLPLIVGFINGQGPVSGRRALALSTLFAVGILVTIALLGAVTAALGRIMGDLGRYGDYIVAAIFFLVGLHLLGALPAPWSAPGQVGLQRRGLLAALLLGLLFGLALGPCTFAFMAPILALTFKLSGAQAGYGLALLALYGLGHCAVIMLAGASAGAVQHYLAWNEKSRGALIVRIVCGVLVLLAGVYLLVR